MRIIIVLIHRSLLFFRPVIDENETSGEYESSEGVSFDEMVKNFDKLLQKKCRSFKSPNHPLIINIVPMQDTLISSTCTDDQWDLPYVVHLWSSVILRNLLPYQIAYSLEVVFFFSKFPFPFFGSYNLEYTLSSTE